jgi:hypothetical protein
MIGQTEVEFSSSVHSRGCISSFPGLSRIVVVAEKDVIRPNRGQLPLVATSGSGASGTLSFITRAPCTRRRRRRCRRTQSRRSSLPSRSTTPSIPLSRSAHPPIPPSTVISQRDNRPQVYECMVRGIAVMRRRADSFVNATQILKVAGVEKGRRTKILEKEILPGKHEIVQGGYGKYQGTWYAPLFVKRNPFLTGALGFPLSEAKNWLSAMVWPLCYRLCLTSSRPPPLGTQCHRCQAKHSPLKPPPPPGHCLRRHRSPVWERQTTTALAA